MTSAMAARGGLVDNGLAGGAGAMSAAIGGLDGSGLAAGGVVDVGDGVVEEQVVLPPGQAR
jgi:hypothetical protein